MERKIPHDILERETSGSGKMVAGQYRGQDLPQEVGDLWKVRRQPIRSRGSAA